MANKKQSKKQLRLDAYLASMGFGTRTQVRALIKSGQVTVRGETVIRPETKVSIDEEEICCQGQQALFRDKEYYILNKPAGTVSAARDAHQKTVLDLIEGRKRPDLFPVGRLDKDTEGLLLITNDGALAHRLLSPKKHVEKTYEALIAGEVRNDHIDRFARGLDIGDEKPTLPAKLRILTAAETSRVRITICEGRFHQIKRMFEAIGLKVLTLKRLSMGPLMLPDDLAPGQYRPLSPEELAALEKIKEIMR